MAIHVQCFGKCWHPSFYSLELFLFSWRHVVSLSCAHSNFAPINVSLPHLWQQMTVFPWKYTNHWPITLVWRCILRPSLDSHRQAISHIAVEFLLVLIAQLYSSVYKGLLFIFFIDETQLLIVQNFLKQLIILYEVLRASTSANTFVAPRLTIC